MESAAIKNELLTLEKKFWTAMKDKDMETAMSLCDDQCIVAGAQGISTVDKQSIGKMIQSAPYTLEEFELYDHAEVKMLTDDVAIIGYKVMEDMNVEGSHVRLNVADTSTWVKKDGKWLCAHHTEAILGDPYGRDRKLI